MQKRGMWSLGLGIASAGRFATLCWSPDPPTPPGEPTPPAPSPGAPAKPFAVFHDAESFNERLNREARAQIKETYGMSEAELKKKLERAKELEAAEAERLKAQQTKEEQLESARQAEEAKRVKAETEAQEARREATVTRVCARLGIKNLDYAGFEAGKRPAATEAELEAYFKEQLQDTTRKSAYGIEVAPPQEVPVPGHTAPATPPNGNPPPPPAPPGSGGPPPVFDAMKASPQEFAAHLGRINAQG